VSIVASGVIGFKSISIGAILMYNGNGRRVGDARTEEKTLYAFCTENVVFSMW
jgi:hypothetical protein